MNQVVAKRVKALEKRIMDVDRLADLLKHVVADVENDLSELRATIGLSGQPGLGIDESAPSSPAASPLDPDQELCTCGHTWEEHHNDEGLEVECGNSYCGCAQFVGTGKPG